MSKRAVRNALRAAGIKSDDGRDCVGHGFRTSFSDWARETGPQADVRERSLAHVEKNKVQKSYASSDLIELRRELMQTWANHISEGITTLDNPPASSTHKESRPT